MEGIKRRLGSGDWRRGDMYGNYYDMKIDNTEKADDYFHCKANFEAAQRGKWGEKQQNILVMQKKGLIILKQNLSRVVSSRILC